MQNPYIIEVEGNYSLLLHAFPQSLHRLILMDALNAEDRLLGGAGQAAVEYLLREDLVLVAQI